MGNTSNLLKEITEHMNIRGIKQSVEEAKEELIDTKYKIEDKNKIYNIDKIIKIIEQTDIFDLSIKDINRYLDKLIILIDFIDE